MQHPPRPTVRSAKHDMLAPTFLRMPMVVRLTGLCRSTIYRLIAENKFPGPVRVGDRAVAWRRTDLDRWSASDARQYPQMKVHRHYAAIEGRSNEREADTP